MQGTTTTLFEKAGLSAERKELYARLDHRNLAPLWEVIGELVPLHPKPSFAPALWKYEDVRPLIMEGGRQLTVKEAERRVVVLENPARRGAAQITRSLYAGLQLILPGEIAPSHRHTASALRFVFEGRGAYTAVEGERTTMEEGDFILTPSWTYHDHGNTGDEPVIWMDGLDIPIANLFDTGFFERHPQQTQPIDRKEGDALARYGRGLLPVNYTPKNLNSPLFSYPYARSREVLDQLYRNGPLDPIDGIKLQYANPGTGGYPMPTIAAFLQFLPAGFDGDSCRSTDGTVYAVADGHGETRIGDTTFAWVKHDIFVAPSWYPVSHRAASDAVLFSFSDRAAQKALGIWREERMK